MANLMIANLIMANLGGPPATAIGISGAGCTDRGGYTAAAPMPRTVVNAADAQKHGALCLDGTPPGFYARNGSGVDADKWIVYFKGGGHCYNPSTCAEAATGAYGSSRHMPLEFSQAPTFHVTSILMARNLHPSTRWAVVPMCAISKLHPCELLSRTVNWFSYQNVT